MFYLSIVLPNYKENKKNKEKKSIEKVKENIKKIKARNLQLKLNFCSFKRLQ